MTLEGVVPCPKRKQICGVKNSTVLIGEVWHFQIESWRMQIVAGTTFFGMIFAKKYTACIVWVWGPVILCSYARWSISFLPGIRWAMSRQTPYFNQWKTRFDSTYALFGRELVKTEFHDWQYLMNILSSFWSMIKYHPRLEMYSAL